MELLLINIRIHSKSEKFMMMMRHKIYPVFLSDKQREIVQYTEKRERMQR